MLQIHPILRQFFSLLTYSGDYFVITNRPRVLPLSWGCAVLLCVGEVQLTLAVSHQKPSV